MPHAGGGGHCGGGGFHSSSSHNFSSTSSAPKYDNSGNLHSYYYVRPGFYVNHSYVPYSYEERKSATNYGLSTFLFLFSLVFIALSMIEISRRGKYSDDRLESRSLDLYSEVYDEKSPDYENNILVTFITYEDSKQFDYMCINGDNVRYYTDFEFGDNYSVFGKSLLNNVPKVYKSEDIYSYLSKSLDSTTDYLSRYYDTPCGDPNNSSIINKIPESSENQKNVLQSSINNFYNTTGVNISFVIETNTEFYSIEWPIVIVMDGLALILIMIGVFYIINKRKNIKIINDAIKNGEAAKYYEGEDPFEVYYKNHPLNS